MVIYTNTTNIVSNRLNNETIPLTKGFQNLEVTDMTSEPIPSQAGESYFIHLEK